MFNPANRDQTRGRFGGEKYERTVVPAAAPIRADFMNLLAPLPQSNRPEDASGLSAAAGERHYWLVPIDGNLPQ